VGELIEFSVEVGGEFWWFEGLRESIGAVATCLREKKHKATHPEDLSFQ
jgi:hypothetical protein